MRRALLVLALLVAHVPGATAAPSNDRLTLYVPGAEGGGFDRTAVALKRALLKEGLVRQVDLIRSPGAGGLVALAQFAGRRLGDTDSLIIGGQSILGAAQYNRSEVSLRDVAPIARLNAIALVIAVRADSSIRDWRDLANIMRSDPAALKWIGGSEGSVDAQLLTILSNQFRIARNSISYSAIPGGGDAIAQRVLDGSHVAAVSSYDELAEHLSSGRLRALAVSSSKPVPGLSAPTLRSQGFDVSFSDWKGAFAPRDVSIARRQHYDALFEKLVASPSWREELRVNHWDDGFMTGQVFANFVQLEDTRLARQIDRTSVSTDWGSRIATVLAGPYRYAAIASVIALVALAALLAVNAANRRKAARREETLQSALDEKELALAQIINDGTAKNFADVNQHIDAEFLRWSLSETEKDIAWLILKGFSFLEIAELRNRSERTVRQQAGAIYAKSGLRSRAELSAYFLEDLFGS